MKAVFDKNEIRLTITDAVGFDGARINKNGVEIANIPLTNGEGFIVNTELVANGDELDIQLYKNEIVSI